MKTQLSLQDIYSILGIACSDDTKLTINCATALNLGKPNSISFYNGKSVYTDSVKNANVSACFIMEEHKHLLPKSVVPIVCENPYLAITQIVEKIYGSGEALPSTFLDISTLKNTDAKYQNISTRANISSCAKIGNNVTIMAGAYIGCNVEIADGVIIHSNASLEHCVIGKNCVIRSGARIGSCGFGFVPNFKTGQHIAIPQIALVVLEDSVDIGSNSCIDRGFLNDTLVGSYTKIDNLVHIGHGVKIGRSCFFAGGTSVAGSCDIGNFCMIGGQSAIANNVVLPDYTEVLGMSGIAKGPVEKGQRIIGSPAIDHITWKRIQAFLHLSIKKK